MGWEEGLIYPFFVHLIAKLLPQTDLQPLPIFRPQPHLLGAIKMLDEVREVKPGLYLGLGTVGPGPFETLRQQPITFLLRGPFNKLNPQEAPSIVRKNLVLDEEGEAFENVIEQPPPPLLS